MRIRLLPLILCLLSLALPVHAVDDSINVNLSVQTCDQDTICEAGIGETVSNCPTDCTDGGGGGGGGGDPLLISDVSSNPATSTALISWNTNFTAFSVLSWGKTLDYELGSVAEAVPATSHSTMLTGLTPSTIYFFKIEVSKEGDSSKTASSLGNTFTTDSVTTPPDLPPANPTNFNATFSIPSDGIELSWTNPADPDFDVVRVMRQTTFFPTAPDEGVLIYEGSGESFLDTDVLPGVTYYYTIFARDDGGNYSGGTVDSESIPPDEEDDEEEEEEDDEENTDQESEPEPPGGAGGNQEEEENMGENEVPPFEELPISEEVLPEIGQLSLIFSQEDGGKLTFGQGTRLSLDGTKNTFIYTNYSAFPEVLKTIAVSLRHPKDNSKVFSFILRANGDKTQYSGVIGPLLDPGEYMATVYLIDHKYARMAKVQGTIIVPAPAPRPILAIGSSVPERIAPIGSAVGVISGITQTIIITTNVKSAYDIYLLVVRFFGAILGFLGLRRKHKPWGTVYDSVTKRPLDPAYVTVKQVAPTGPASAPVVADAITDLDGRYGFLLPGGRYIMSVGKTHYSFPSKTLAGKSIDELYGNIYHGEEILTAEGEVITRNIPLDPEGFDWNEFVKNKQTLFRLYSRREKIKSLIFDVLYGVGFVFTLFSTIITPSPFNFSILSLYVVLFVVQTSWRATFRAVAIRDAQSGEPYSFAIVRVFLSNLNQEVKRIVADELGRFYLLVAPGKYYITIDAKQQDASYKRVYRSVELNLPKGVLNGDIVIGKSIEEFRMQTAK